MNLPSLFGNIGQALQQAGDFMKVERTKTNRLVATAKQGNVKLSRTVYPTTGRIVETKSYSLGK